MPPTGFEPALHSRSQTTPVRRKLAELTDAMDLGADLLQQIAKRKPSG